VNDLIDTTEMYLRTIFELEEEGIVPLRARIAERLGQSGPTVSQTVARMERDGLVLLTDERHLELTEAGRERATSVMRKHRLAERLLLDVIGLDWAEVHVEACRWEHVMSDAVEHRLTELLGHPRTSPYGNPIPPRSDAAPSAHAVPPAVDDAIPADEAARRGGSFAVARIIEVVQNEPDVMALLQSVGALPGAVVTFAFAGDDVAITGAGHTARVAADVAAGIRVNPA